MKETRLKWRSITYSRCERKARLMEEQPTIGLRGGFDYNKHYAKQKNRF
jgi:hypothetical protein